MSKDKQTFNHNPNQSSVDWVIGEILKHQMTYYGTSSMPLRIIQQAKAMHKEEMIYAHETGEVVGNGRLTHPAFFKDKNSEQYYIETFGGEDDKE